MDFAEREAARVLWLGSVASWCTPELILRYFIPLSQEDVTAVRLINKSPTELFPYAFISFKSIDSAMRCFRRYNNTTISLPVSLLLPVPSHVVRLSHSRCVCRRASELSNYLSPSGNSESLTGLAELAVDVIATISQFATRLPARMQLGCQLSFTLNIPGGLTATRTAMSGGQLACLRGQGDYLLPPHSADLNTLRCLGSLPGALIAAHESVTRDGSNIQTHALVQKFHMNPHQWWPQRSQARSTVAHPLIQPTPISDQFSGSESATFTSFSSYSTPPEHALCRPWGWTVQPMQEIPSLQAGFSDTTLFVPPRVQPFSNIDSPCSVAAPNQNTRRDAFGLDQSAL